MFTSVRMFINKQSRVFSPYKLKPFLSVPLKVPLCLFHLSHCLPAIKHTHSARLPPPLSPLPVNPSGGACLLLPSLLYLASIFDRLEGDTLGPEQI